MSWTRIFPVLTDDLVASYRAQASAGDESLLDDWCKVAKVINPRTGRHLVVASLFWRNARKDEDELPPITRQLMVDAAKLGLVSRFSPWEHYVQPLLDGAAALKIARPDIVFRVYLAADLEFLVEDLVTAGCEVMLMQGSSLRHNPGAMWRFLALEEEGRWMTITDADRAPQVLHDIERTEQIMKAGLGLWRVPYLFDSTLHDNHPGYYRPINACQFGALGGYPVTELMRAFLWHTVKGTMPNECSITDTREDAGTLPIYGTDWPSYGFDEWFLIAVMYPRFAGSGVLTFVPWNERQANHWFALDIEYVTWANPKSEILYFGGSELAEKLEICKATPPAESPILERMLQDKLSVRAARTAPAAPGTKAPLTLAVARYNEDLRWLLQVPEDIQVILYNKGKKIPDKKVLQRIDRLVTLPNRGRESDTYLHHLQHHPHSAAEEWTAFCQGDPFPHSPDFLKLLERRDLWTEVQPLTAGYAEYCEVPPPSARILDDAEWIAGMPVRTELCSAHTLDILGWQDEVGGRRFFKDYCLHHHLRRGMSISGHFLESCGLTEIAEQAWRAALAQFAYGAMFAVRNDRLPLVPAACIPQMRRLACGHYSNGYVFERLWLHFFGLPFIHAERHAVAERWSPWSLAEA